MNEGQTHFFNCHAIKKKRINYTNEEKWKKKKIQSHVILLRVISWKFMIADVSISTIWVHHSFSRVRRANRRVAKGYNHQNATRIRSRWPACTYDDTVAESSHTLVQGYVHRRYIRGRLHTHTRTHTHTHICDMYTWSCTDSISNVPT